jgi:hypothetical protein
MHPDRTTQLRSTATVLCTVIAKRDTLDLKTQTLLFEAILQKHWCDATVGTLYTLCEAIVKGASVTEALNEGSEVCTEAQNRASGHLQDLLRTHII